MFQRKEVCKLTGIEEGRFKILAHRGQLPSLQAEDEGADAQEAAGWKRYSALDVLMIALAERLMGQIGYADGLRPDTAAKIVSNALSGLDLDPLAADTAPDDRWIGYVGEPAEPGSIDGGWNVSGSVAQVALRIVESAADGNRPARVFLINVSEVLREVRHRAEAGQITFPGEA
jgi:hypothetical protein